MGLDLSAKNMIAMIDRLYADGRSTVTTEEVVKASREWQLGRDGERAVASLPKASYTKQQLSDEISGAVLNQGLRK